MKSRKKKSLIFFAALVLLLAVIIYILPRITELFVSSYVLEYGEMKISDEAEICLVRSENVYTSGGSGIANYYIEDGTLVRKGTTIMDFSDSSDGGASGEFDDVLEKLGDDAVATGDFVVSEGGIVTYAADGYESRITPDNMDKITYEKLEDLKDAETCELSREKIAKGEPVFKVVDRTKWYMVCFTDEKSEKRYEEGQSVQVEFEDSVIDAKVYEVGKEDGRLRVILETDAYYEPFARIRTAEAILTTYNEKGLIVNNDSIGKVKDQEGVYVRNRVGEYDFVPIMVYLTDGEKSLVADGKYYDAKGNLVETVEIYDEILKEPK